METHRFRCASPPPSRAKMAPVISPEFRRGIALLNQSHFFEAHEVLEDVWRPMPMADTNRGVMQGLVQVAVALHHYSTGNLTGALSVMRRAARNLAPASEHALGVRMDLLRPVLAAWITALESGTPPAARPHIEFVEEGDARERRQVAGRE
jgi:predicted metal-dependent hydrolase